MVLRGRQTNDEQTFVKFDKALATGGVAGGVATGETRRFFTRAWEFYDSLRFAFFYWFCLPNALFWVGGWFSKMPVLLPPMYL